MKAFDDIAPGMTFTSASRTVTEADVVNYAGVTGDFNPLHMDAAWAAGGPFGARVAHGLLVTAVSNGLRSDVDDWDVLAYLQTTRKFVGPVFFGDTIAVRGAVREVRRSTSKPDRGIVTVEIRAINQHGETVQEGEDVYMVGSAS